MRKITMRLFGYKKNLFAYTLCFTVALAVFLASLTPLIQKSNKQRQEAKKYGLDSVVEIKSAFTSKNLNRSATHIAPNGKIYNLFTLILESIDNAPLELGEILNEKGEFIQKISIPSSKFFEGEGGAFYSVLAVSSNNLKGSSFVVSVLPFSGKQYASFIVEMKDTAVNRIIKLNDFSSGGRRKIYDSLTQLDSGTYIYSDRDKDYRDADKNDVSLWYATENNNGKFSLKNTELILEENNIDKCRPMLYAQNDYLYIANCPKNGEIWRFTYEETDKGLMLENPKKVLNAKEQIGGESYSAIDTFSIIGNEIIVNYQEAYTLINQAVSVNPLTIYNFDNKVIETYDLTKINLVRKKYGYSLFEFGVNNLQIEGKTLYITSETYKGNVRENGFLTFSKMRVGD